MRATSEREARWQQQQDEQSNFFVARATDAYLLLQELKSTEEPSTFLHHLKAQIDAPISNYTSDQHRVMKQACSEIINVVVKLFGAGSGQEGSLWNTQHTSLKFKRSLLQSKERKQRRHATTKPTFGLGLIILMSFGSSAPATSYDCSSSVSTLPTGP
ncbi:hypothetical protein ON010_g17054 [Phytophthora cinnamomi]|nr:hypothetical protein ON010_g17054 [Phytophthora cinnamomi]